MKERPILFSAPMVRKVLTDEKTQTRRLVKPQPVYVRDVGAYANGAFVAKEPVMDGGKEIGWRDVTVVPPWTPGLLLWVRETFGYDAHDGRPVFFADHPNAKENRSDGPEVWRWKPSIFMPRKLSRLTLEVTGVRVERLKDISEADAVAEGVEPGTPSTWARTSYEALWESINGAGSWAASPWVWVVEFRRVQP